MGFPYSDDSIWVQEQIMLLNRYSRPTEATGAIPKRREAISRDEPSTSSWNPFTVPIAELRAIANEEPLAGNTIF